jgi:hypothetical protein
MAAFFWSIAGVVGQMAFKVIVENMILKAIKSEELWKKVVLMGLEKLVASTETKADDKLLEETKKAWEL